MMKILLINSNPVVSRLVAMSVQNEDIALEEVKQASEIDSKRRYDLIMIDDMSYTEKVAEAIARIESLGRIFFSGRESGEEIGREIDVVIKKPFLPSQVDSVIREYMETYVVRNEEERSEVVDRDAEMIYEEPVLDEKEVAHIKSLLEEIETQRDGDEIEDETLLLQKKTEIITEQLEKEGIQIIPEEQIVDMLENETVSETKEPLSVLERELKKAIGKSLKRIKPKKLRKVLKGAEITITIRFGKDM